MKTIFNKKFKKVILTSLVAIFTLSVASFFSSADLFARADSAPTAKAELFLPSSELEYKAITSPIDVYSDDSITAIVQKNAQGSSSLLIYSNGEYKEYNSIYSITQVKKANAKTLLILENSQVCEIDAITTEETKLKDVEGSQITGNYFDLNENYLVTTSGDLAIVYEKTATGYAIKGTLSVKHQSPVAINEKGQIFYTAGNETKTDLCFSHVDDLKTSNIITTIQENVNPSKLIANNDFVYLIVNDTLKRASLSNSLISTLLDDGKMSAYNLGNIQEPKSVAFRKGNLIIADGSLNAIQEFRINETEQLEFTGFAIASGKTAYNRTSTASLEVERQGNTLAMLDEKQLMINCPVSEDKYARVNFKNFFKSDLVKESSENMPNAFALGKNTVLLSYNHDDALGYLRLLDYTTGELTDIPNLFVGNRIKDVCYQNGYYYVYATSGTSYKDVYKIKENDDVPTPILVNSFKNFGFDFSCITVDVFGNIYLANADSGAVYFCDVKNDYRTTQKTTIQGVSKISTDFSGRLYVLANGILYTLNGENLIDTTPSTPDINNAINTIKSFTMSYDKKEVYFIFNGVEYVCKTTDLNNYAISDVTVSDDSFKLTAPTTQFENLKIATVNENANVYSVKRNGEGFDFNGLIHPESEYVFVCNIVVSEDFTLCVLVGQNGTVLINSNDLTFNQPQQAQMNKTLYVTTDAHLYYFPIITPKTTYALFDEDVIKLSKSTELKVSEQVEFLGKDFYFATATVGEKEVSGFIPVSFVTNWLADDFTLSDYTVVTLNKTELFSDLTLSTKICDIEKGQKVRLISKENGVAKVAFTIDGETFTIGYVKENAIDNAPARAIRNVLVIVAVGAAVCSSLLYFILKKRR